MVLVEAPDPSSVACPQCAAQPSEPCIWPVVLDVSQGPPPLFHAERMEAASFMASLQPGDAPSEEKFVGAVNDSGLV